VGTVGTQPLRCPPEEITPNEGPQICGDPGGRPRARHGISQKPVLQKIQAVSVALDLHNGLENELAQVLGVSGLTGEQRWAEQILGGIESLRANIDHLPIREGVPLSVCRGLVRDPLVHLKVGRDETRLPSCH
jgi:hypothetical protein